MKILLLFVTAVALCAQSLHPASPISLAGEKLELGMPRDAALAKLAVAPNTRLQEVGTDFYQVLSKNDAGWAAAGDIIFRGGVLTRVCVNMERSGKPAAFDAFTAIYAAIKDEHTGSPSRVWAGLNQQSDPPVPEVHLIFPDREVVMSASAPEGAALVFIQVYFPIVLAAPSDAPKPSKI
jgi:hypothetical protein